MRAPQELVKPQRHVVGRRKALSWLRALMAVALAAEVAGTAAQAGRAQADFPDRPPHVIEFRVWFSVVGQPGRVERLTRSGLPAAGQLRVVFADEAPDLARAVSEFVASSRQAMAVARSGQDRGVGTLVGSLGYPVRLAIGTRGILPADEEAELPDLQETALSIELTPLSVDPDGRILTRVTLQLGTRASPRSSYSHTLWLDGQEGAPLAFLWASSATDATLSSGDVYALGVSARLVEAPGPDVDMVRVAEMAPLEGAFFGILGKRHPSRPARPPSPRLQIGIEAWLSRDAPVWGLDLTQPVWDGAWLLEAGLSWGQQSAEVEGRATLRFRLVHELALLVEGSARFGSTGQVISPTVGLGLTEITHPLAGLSLEARYLPVVYARHDPSEAWLRKEAAWKAGVTVRKGGWSLSLEAGRFSLRGLSGKGSVSVQLGRHFSLHTGYQVFPEAGRSFVLAGLTFRSGP